MKESNHTIDELKQEYEQTITECKDNIEKNVPWKEFVRDKTEGLRKSVPPEAKRAIIKDFRFFEGV